MKNIDISRNWPEGCSLNINVSFKWKMTVTMQLKQAQKRLKDNKINGLSSDHKCIISPKLVSKAKKLRVWVRWPTNMSQFVGQGASGGGCKYLSAVHTVRFHLITAVVQFSQIIHIVLDKHWPNLKSPPSWVTDGGREKHTKHCSLHLHFHLIFLGR